MKLLTVLVVVSSLIAFVSSAQESEGGGEEHPEQPPSPDHGNDNGNHEHQQNGGQQGQSGKDGKEGEQGYQQGYNQGIKPYSYGYNTGIKPYSYNYYQPYGGKPQVSQTGGEEMTNGKPTGKGQPADAGQKQGPPPQIPPIPINIDFPDFSAFGLAPPVPPNQQNANYRAQPQQQIPINFGPQQQQQQSTPPPFNYAEYGIPTDVGSATGVQSGSPFSGLGFGQQQQQQPQQASFPFGGGAANGDDFGIFGGGNNNGNNNNNNNNLPLIPVLESGTNNNNNNANSGFGIPGIVGPNDFSVAASDFEPLNIVDNLVPLNYPSNPITSVPGNFERPTAITSGAPASGLNGRNSGITSNGGMVNLRQQQQPSTSSRQHGGNHKRMSKLTGKSMANKTTSPSNKVVTTSKNDTSNADSSSGTMNSQSPSSAALMAQRRHYKLAVLPSNHPGELKEGDGESNLRAKRSINEQPHEQLTKFDPHSAYAILNMDPQYTNPNQGVYSYYPAYNNPV